MYKDVVGNEIKIGHIIAVARYGRGNSLSCGIVTDIVKTKKAAWVHFSRIYNIQQTAANSSKAQLGSNNDNISIVRAGDGNPALIKTAKILIASKVLPFDYTLGEPVKEEEEVIITLEGATTVLNQAKKIISGKGGGDISDDFLGSLGAPKSLGGNE